jgi:hypothetical protein
MKPSAKGGSAFSFIDIDIGAGGSCHRQFVIGVSSLWSMIPSPAKCAPFLCAYGSTGDS